MDDNGKILIFQEKLVVEEVLSIEINMGIYIFELEVIDYIFFGQEYDLGGDLFFKLVDSGLFFYVVNMDFEWVDIGKVFDYWQVIWGVFFWEIKNV